MRRVIVLIVVVAMLVLLGNYYNIDWPVLHQGNGELIRFHVIANSDTLEDQALKNAVRDRLISSIGEEFKEADSIKEARKVLLTNENKMLQEAQLEVANWGKNYEIKLEYGDFPFPTKSYGSLVLPSGEYEALRIVIGEGKGQNWWCVLFPPLCFVDISTSLARDEARPVMKEQKQASERKVKVKLKLLEVFQDNKNEKQKSNNVI
jgi:stage II sporulation protein R